MTAKITENDSENPREVVKIEILGQKIADELKKMFVNLGVIDKDGGSSENILKLTIAIISEFLSKTALKSLEDCDCESCKNSKQYFNAIVELTDDLSRQLLQNFVDFDREKELSDLSFIEVTTLKEEESE